jgi:type IV pilus assembly protein PilC
VAEQTESKPLKVVINQVISDVEAGASFSAALTKHPAIFNKIYISMMAAGEVSGTLDTSLERLADQQEKDAEILAKVRGAMVYPIIVILVMTAVVTFMIVTVLPQVGELYKGLNGVKLPLLTRLLLAVSHAISAFWWVVMLAVIGAGYVFSRWIRIPAGRQIIDKLKMRMWPIGPLFMKMYMARFARTASTLVASGVPLIQVLEITAEGVNNVHVGSSIKSAIEKVRGGKALSVALENDPNFLVLVPNMLRIGEQSGAIESMLAKVADYYEKEVNTQIKNISTIIEPLLMVILGVVALVIVAAILLPIYSLVGKSIVK